MLKWKIQKAVCDAVGNLRFMGLELGGVAKCILGARVRVGCEKATGEWNTESDGCLRRVRERGVGVGGAVGCRVLFTCEERGLVVKC